MKLEYKKAFLRNIKKIKDTQTKNMVLDVIDECKKAHKISDIKHCEPLTGKGKYYKIKRSSYRFGIKIDKGIITLLTFGTRQSFYDNFPPHK